MAPSTSSRTNNTLPRLAVQISVTVAASTGPCRTRCRSVSTAARSRSSRSMRRTRARCHNASNPGGAAAVGPHRGDEEHEIGVDQLPHERRRRRVQEMKIVDEQHERTVRRLRPQHRPHLRHHRHQIAAFVADAGRKQVGQRTRAGSTVSPPSLSPGPRSDRSHRPWPSTGRPAGSCRRRPARESRTRALAGRRGWPRTARPPRAGPPEATARALERSWVQRTPSRSGLDRRSPRPHTQIEEAPEPSTHCSRPRPDPLRTVAHQAAAVVLAEPLITGTSATHVIQHTPTRHRAARRRPRRRRQPRRPRHSAHAAPPVTNTNNGVTAHGTYATVNLTSNIPAHVTGGTDQPMSGTAPYHHAAAGTRFERYHDGGPGRPWHDVPRRRRRARTKHPVQVTVMAWGPVNNTFGWAVNQSTFTTQRCFVSINLTRLDVSNDGDPSGCGEIFGSVLGGRRRSVRLVRNRSSGPCRVGARSRLTGRKP